ncbi:MAG: helical backbone metal receptor [Kofleriaceae bacterium]
MSTHRLLDDLGRTVLLPRPPRRIVSLVPSDTYSVWALGAGDRVVGRTRYCVEPAELAAVPEVGGTKDVDVERVISLAPDLVLANQEENGRAALEALAGRVPILVALPRRVAAGMAHLARLARALGVERDPAVRALLARAYARGPAASPPTRRAFVPIWRDPWMTFNGDTYGHDALAHAGVGNAFGDRARLYPLAADLGKAPATGAGERDERYPRLALTEIVARAPDLVVLPDEPYAFADAEAAELAAALPSARVVRVSGKDLFWHGAWAIDGLPRLAAALQEP